ncbi:hypothetical protein JG491_33070 [Streptomyces sp. CRPSP2-6A1]|uniref:hypothetical protein n=1 Tax=Streptomyces TaxID=1883 RepID=UPI0018F0D1C2|nr:hypothetical protein [Streptomyces sp. CRPSP2-6A1]MBJ7004841.1 hypothetical protein [Streptomyces sp. CRPSP2-6A1]
MTTSPDPDHTPLFDMDAPVPPPPVEQLLALAGLYTQHNDRIDLWRHGRADLGTDAYAASARYLERATYACIKTVRKHRMPTVEPVTNAVVRLKQIAHLTSAAARYLTTALPFLSDADAERPLPDPRRGFGQRVQLARELASLAPVAIIESATDIADALPRHACSSSPSHGIDSVQYDLLFQVALGHVTVFEEIQYVRVHTTKAAPETLRELELRRLVCREPESAPPPYYGGEPFDRVRLTALGIALVSAVISCRTLIGPPAASPAVAPAPTPARARAHR